MCGIVGIFPENTAYAEAMLEAIAHRGRDASNVVSLTGGAIGHVLHALVGDVAQPVQGKGTLLFNGEIYNWKLLAEQESVSVANDTQLLLHLLDTHGPQETRNKLDGVYAYVYVRDGTVTLERDVLGVKPLWYAHDAVFAFASEEKALSSIGLLARELHPRTTLTYDIKENTLHASVRPLAFQETNEPLNQLLVQAVTKRIPDSQQVGVLFSGGVDSSLLALLAKNAGVSVTLYVAALDDPEKSDPHDLVAARHAATQLDLPLVEVTATVPEVQELLPALMQAIETANPVKVGVAIPFWLCAQQASKDGLRVLLSGLGAEEVFAGYHRHKQAEDINQECLRGLRAMHERDLYRDDVVGMSHTLEIRLPLLDLAVVSAGLAIPGERKIVDGMGKMPLRQAAQELGLPNEIALRPKKAAQYGSQFDAAIEKIARQHGMRKGEYLKHVFGLGVPVCALLSSGKDSVYAMHVMQKMNYDVVCCATIISRNPDSYMYHTPVAQLAEQQAASMRIPWLSEETSGVKEEELEAMKTVLQKAIDQFHIKGVVSGALFSNYQRERIERMCEELGLRVYAPLWHLDQEQEVREILDAGFTFVLSKVAAQGLDKSFVGRPITHEDVDYFRDHLHLNVAGEGGEYESLVIDGPLFSDPISIEGYDVVCESQGSVEICSLVPPQ